MERRSPHMRPDNFELDKTLTPTGDQPQAIHELIEGLNAGISDQILLGVTGSGKTFTMANIIEKTQRPALIMAPNKTLAAQLFQEFKEFFPRNSVEFFISYYDYYQPEAYVPSTDTFIDKVSSINDDIDKMRHSATRALFERKDTIIVSSVSCIYGLGDPESYLNAMIFIEVGMACPRDEFLRKLIEIRYERNDLALERGKFRVRGDLVEIVPAHEKDRAVRVEFWAGEIERISIIDTLQGATLEETKRIAIYPTSHYVTGGRDLDEVIREITLDLKERVLAFKQEGKLVEAQRIEQRTLHDIEMLRELGYCQGIENYSRYLTNRKPGEPPPTLFDYFPKNFLLFLDESHITVPQIGGMYRGDRMRKETLVNFGFRLPAALDNRPLTFEEFEARRGQCIYVSATPGKYELARTNGSFVQQIIRPTGLVDPMIEVRPATHQIDDLLGEIKKTISAGFRVLVTTLTKKMAEEITIYFKRLDIKIKYLHSDIQSIERIELLRDLRRGEFDVLVGINLLREGLDLPEVQLVAILDADKEGFLRSRSSLIQTVGRAARNVQGRVILYADRVTDSMNACLQETERRRNIQLKHNQTHQIEPQTIIKKIPEHLKKLYNLDFGDEDFERLNQLVSQLPDPSVIHDSKKLDKEVKRLTKAMHTASQKMAFEEAATLRDQISLLKEQALRLMNAEDSLLPTDKDFH